MFIEILRTLLDFYLIKESNELVEVARRTERGGKRNVIEVDVFTII